MKVRKTIVAMLLSLAVLVLLIGYAKCPGPDIWLWTTDAAGTTEIQQFMVGDPVYLRTNPGLAAYAFPEDSVFRVYIFEGNIAFTEGESIPGSHTPLGLTPLDVSTDSEGRFGPVMIWDHCTYTPPLTEYTVLLDCLVIKGDPANGIGKYNEVRDYRDDLCTHTPTWPSFFVIPEVLFGTIAALAGMFGSLGYFALRKKNQSR